MFQLSNVQYRDILDIPQMIINKNKISCIVGESGTNY